MKKIVVALLFLNLALVAALIYSLKTRPADSEPRLPKQAAVLRTEKSSVQSTNNFHWRQIESGDYREYISNLRRIGCPEETIRDIIIADVNKLYAARRAELVHENDSRKNWWQPKQQPIQKANQSDQLVRDLEPAQPALIR